MLDEPTAAELSKQFPSGWLRVWGVTPGKGGVNRRKWIKFAAGDRVLFAGNNRIFASTSIRFKLHNRRLASFLWGTDAEGETWEHIYFVGSVRDQNIPVRRLAEVAGFVPRFTVLGVNILSSEKSAAILEAFDLADD